jgi:hypothetical protein
VFSSLLSLFGDRVEFFLYAFINFYYLQSNLVTLIWLTFSWARDLKFCTHV